MSILIKFNGLVACVVASHITFATINTHFRVNQGNLKFEKFVSVSRFLE